MLFFGIGCFVLDQLLFFEHPLYACWTTSRNALSWYLVGRFLSLRIITRQGVHFSKQFISAATVQYNSIICDWFDLHVFRLQKQRWFMSFNLTSQNVQKYFQISSHFNLFSFCAFEFGSVNKSIYAVEMRAHTKISLVW